MNYFQIKDSQFVKRKFILPENNEISTEDFHALLRVCEHLTEVVEVLSATRTGLHVSADRIYEIASDKTDTLLKSSLLALEAKQYQIFVANTIVDFCTRVETAICLSQEIKGKTYKLMENNYVMACEEGFEEVLKDLIMARSRLNNLYVSVNILVVISYFLYHALGFINSFAFGCSRPGLIDCNSLKKLAVPILDYVAESFDRSFEFDIARRCLLEYEVVSSETLRSLNVGNDSLVIRFMAQTRDLSINFIKSILILLPDGGRKY